MPRKRRKEKKTLFLSQYRRRPMIFAQTPQTHQTRAFNVPATIYTSWTIGKRQMPSPVNITYTCTHRWYIICTWYLFNNRTKVQKRISPVVCRCCNGNILFRVGFTLPFIYLNIHGQCMVSHRHQLTFRNVYLHLKEYCMNLFLFLSHGQYGYLYYDVTIDILMW